MIVDSSAVMAVLLDEPESERIQDVVASTESVQMSEGTFIELGIVIDRRDNPVLSRRLDQLLDAWGVEFVAVDRGQALRARQAHRDFGRGSGHRAQLNFGDCFAYALASTTGQPLLFKGDDFTHTDLRPALG